MKLTIISIHFIILAAPCLAEHCYGEIEDQNQGTTEEIQLEETENNESNVVPNTTNIVPNTTEGVPPEEAKTIKTTEEPEDDSDVDDTELDEQGKAWVFKNVNAKFIPDIPEKCIQL